MTDRKGMSTAVAMTALLLMGIFVFAFATYSRNEVQLVRRAIEHKRAEYLALGGIEWARDQLQKRRWYAAENKYWGVHSETDPFGPGTGRLRVVCEDMRHPEIRQYAFREAAMLSHVNVYSQAVCGRRTVLIYGRFIMSPMPWLRSDTTDGAPDPEDVSSLGEFQAGELPVLVPKFPFEGGFLDGRVESVYVTTGQSVAINAPLVRVMLLGAGEPTEVTAPAPGKVKRVLVKQGDVLPAGAPLVVLEPDDSSASRTVPFTLKTMARITKISESNLAELDVGSPDARETIRAFIEAHSKDFIENHVRTQQLTSGVATNPLPETVSAQNVLRLLPAGSTPAVPDPLAAGNTFIQNRLLGFAWPCTPPEQLEQARRDVNFVLDLQPPKSNPLVRKLFDATGTPYKTSSPVKSIAGPDAGKALLDVTAVPLADSDFVNRAGIYREAQWSHNCRWTGKFATGAGGFDTSTLGPGVTVDGVFYQGVSCSQRPYDRPYILFTEPGGKGKSIKVGHVLNFYRMFFTEAGAVAPTQQIRLDLDIIDRVVYPPPGPTPMGGGAGDFG
ncbi:MAG: hypothetical protein HYY25_00745 [Candidatus Wallbacteria bacterium]|nr:hypothetical protein [Candidatus Wallbacteria bacterium]